VWPDPFKWNVSLYHDSKIYDFDKCILHGEDRNDRYEGRLRNNDITRPAISVILILQAHYSMCCWFNSPYPLPPLPTQPPLTVPFPLRLLSERDKEGWKKEREKSTRREVEGVGLCPRAVPKIDREHASTRVRPLVWLSVCVRVCARVRVQYLCVCVSVCVCVYTSTTVGTSTWCHLQAERYLYLRHIFYMP